MIKNQFGDVIFEEQFLRINYLKLFDIFQDVFFTPGEVKHWKR